MSEFEKEATMRRSMTPGEARRKAQDMGLPPPVVEFIVTQFDLFEKNGQWINDDDPIDSFEVHPGSDGRLAFGMSWDHVLDELREVMETEVSGTDDEEIDRVFDAFFEE